MRASLLFLNKSFWKSPFNIAFAFVVPSLFICASCLSWNLFGGTISPVLIFPSVSYISIVFIGLIVIPTIIFEYRKSNILRRIEDSGNKKISFVWAMGIFFTILFFATYFFNCFIGTLSMINNQQVQIMWQTANYGSLFYSLIVTILLCSTIGITVGLNAKSIVFIQVFGVSFVLISAFLGFWIAPATLLTAEPSYNAILTISYVWPLRYTSHLFLQSWLQTFSFNFWHSSIFDFVNPYSSALFINYPDFTTGFWNIVSIPNKIADIVYPIAFVCLLGGINAYVWKFGKSKE